MFEFDGILLKPCLLQPCFHVAGDSGCQRVRLEQSLEFKGGVITSTGRVQEVSSQQILVGIVPVGSGGTTCLTLLV